MDIIFLIKTTLDNQNSFYNDLNLRGYFHLKYYSLKSKTIP
jgi:hypothetical protein